MFLSALASDAGCKLVVGDPDCSLDALPRPRNRSHRLGATIDAMKPRRQANSIRLEAADWQTAHQLVAQRRLNSLAELIRELIREAAKGVSAPKVPPSIVDLAERLDISVDGTMAVAG